MAEIDVIVPVYNVERYLRKCLDSILAQTFRDFQLILVDDGSTDGSGAICGEYAAKDGRVQVLRMEHQGVSAARNRGLEESVSERIAFIDSDDRVAPDYLETLYRCMEDYQADLVISCGVTVLESREAGKTRPRPQTAELVSKAEAYRRVFISENGLSVAPWGKLYHRSAFRSVRYPVGEIFEDARVIDQIIENCGRIVCTSYAGYFYLRRRGSITHSRITPDYMAGIRNVRRLWDIIRERYPQIENAAKTYYLWAVFDLLNQAVMDPAWRAEAERLRRELLGEVRFIFSCGYFTFDYRAAALCLLPGLFWYKLAWKLYLRCTGKLSGTEVP